MWEHKDNKRKSDTYAMDVSIMFSSWLIYTIKIKNNWKFFSSRSDPLYSSRASDLRVRAERVGECFRQKLFFLTRVCQTRRTENTRRPLPPSSFHNSPPSSSTMRPPFRSFPPHSAGGSLKTPLRDNQCASPPACLLQRGWSFARCRQTADGGGTRTAGRLLWPQSCGQIPARARVHVWNDGHGSCRGK